MADHNTLIGSTSREIEGGTVLIGGVLREIESGTVLVDGVEREIGIQSEPKFTVSITSVGYHSKSSGYKAYAYVTINGKKYDTTTTLELEEGTTIACFVKQANTGRAIVYVDGTRVVNTTTSETYNHALTSNINIELSASSPNESTSQAAGSIKITTT